MRQQRTWNRPWIPLVCVIAAAGAGCTSSANPMQPTAPLLSEGTGATPVQRTVGTIDAALPLLGPELAAVRRATAKFHNADDAAAAGYVFGEHCVSSPAGVSPAGVMGMHVPNPTLAASQALDPERPEVLLYLEKPGGGLRLIGVEYVQTVLLRNPDTGLVAPWFSASPWPANYQVVTPTPQLFGQTFDGPMPGHSSTMPWHWDLHVWVWAHNPSGMFAQWNPSLSCN